MKFQVVLLLHRWILLYLPTIFLCGCTHVQMGLFLLHESPIADNEESVQRGRVAFERNCTSCHGDNADGRGSAASSLTPTPTNFRDPLYTKSAARVAARITFGKGDAMPAFRGALSSNEIWDIAHYLKSLR